MSLENVIRPFQADDVFNARVITPVVQPTAAEKADVDKVWGGSNSGLYNHWQLSGLVGGQVVYTEKSRETEKVRITNPEDDQQFVDVERIKKLVMASTGGDEIHFNFDTP